MQVRLLFVPGPHGAQLIDDTYNASTPSVLSSLALLADLGGRRRVAVLGDMRELGSVAHEEHRVVGRRAGEIAEVVVTYGDLARLIAEEAQAVPRPKERPLTVRSFGLDQRGELVAYLRDELRDGDVALLKGSRGLRMEQLVAALRTDAGGESDVGPTPDAVREA
ncbi:MAG: hypothetical protein H0W06_07035 [Chloroflexia bacterium]|nr:hypothetical protein [Chloroflexia bacterium]